MIFHARTGRLSIDRPESLLTIYGRLIQSFGGVNGAGPGCVTFSMRQEKIGVAVSVMPDGGADPGSLDK